MSDKEYDRLVEAQKRGEAPVDQSVPENAELDTRRSKTGLGVGALSGQEIIGWDDGAQEPIYGTAPATATERAPELAATSRILGYDDNDQSPIFASGPPTGAGAEPEVTAQAAPGEHMVFDDDQSGGRMVNLGDTTGQSNIGSASEASGGQTTAGGGGDDQA